LSVSSVRHFGEVDFDLCPVKGVQSNSHLIFPYKPSIEGNIPDLPNKYIALFATSKEATDAAKKSEENIKILWRGICEDVWNELLAGLPVVTSGTRAQWEAQTNPEKVFEFFWIVVEGDEDHYKEWLTKTQYLFDRRKHLRNFERQDEAGEKSTISGQRGALRGAGEERKDVGAFWKQVTATARLSTRDINKDGSERLDAIDMVKRFAHLSDTLAKLVGHQTSLTLKAGFPSTSSIAAASYIEQLIPVSGDPAVSAALSRWLHESNKLGASITPTVPMLIKLAEQHEQGPSPKILERDGDCFFPETFSESRLEKEFRLGDQRKREQLAQNGPEAIQALLQATDALTPPLTHPTPYYAMIQMDGDKMGKLINGVQGREEHQAMNVALSAFSRLDVPELVEQRYPGKLIYAGGDDVFALASLARNAQRISGESGAQLIKTVLNLVDELRQRYRTTVQKAVVDAPPTDTSPQPESRKKLVTMSAGVAIAHHYTPLSYVRRVSKEAEQLAKNHYGRNALVVTVLRRSGEQTRVGCQWHYDELAIDDAQPIPLFSFFYDLFVDDVLAPSCVYNLLEEAPALVALTALTPEALREAQRSEITRILCRQRDLRKVTNFCDEELREKAGQLVDLAKAMDAAEHPKLEPQQGKAIELHAEGRRYGLVEVFGWLLVMLFLAGRARKEQA
jgi:CRISPR-associated protein Cmr2